MFSVVFPGQGSQTVGMAKELYDNKSYIKELFIRADEILGFSLSKLILEGPKTELDPTENTQPAIFLVSYSIFEMIKRESNFD
jgi:(acyl-carrier-protein) S-malonyltransferase